MQKWCSIESLAKAAHFALNDSRDDFTFDPFNYEDIRANLDRVLQALQTQVASGQYYPAPLLKMDVPKNDRSVRPGSTLPIIDSIYLYAIAQRLAPLLDPLLSDSAYAWRLNPSADRSGQPLFTDRSDPEPAPDPPVAAVTEDTASEDEDPDIDFPYNWFANWKLFHEASKATSMQYDHVAATDRVAYFENISLDVLREQIKEKLDITDEVKELVHRLFRLLEFWAWAPDGILPRAFGLPQGNNVSSFLSNIYLMDLDDAMLQVVSNDATKYFRYVDDIKLYTSDRDQARKALVTLEKVLRSLNLNVQSAKTRVDPAPDAFNATAESWLGRMQDNDEASYENAIVFFDNVLPHEDADTFQRPYLRCLTLLRNNQDPRAVPLALANFLGDPSYKALSKQFIYLRAFTPLIHYASEIVGRLSDSRFTFPYHRAFMYRLASYSRDHSTQLVEMAMSDATDSSQDWFVRMSALFCLHSFRLSGGELARVGRLVESEPQLQVTRGTFLVLCQHAGEELDWVFEKLSLFNAPHQEYLRRYMRRLRSDEQLATRSLSSARQASVNAPGFISVLHKFDILKATRDPSQRASFSTLIDQKIDDTQGSDWPRLSGRLQGIRDAFVLRP